MNHRPAKLIVVEDAKKPEERTREALRKRLVEMIRKNETNRREKAR